MQGPEGKSDLNKDSLSSQLNPPPPGVGRMAIVAWCHVRKGYYPVIIHDSWYTGKSDTPKEAFALPDSVPAIVKIAEVIVHWIRAIEIGLKEREMRRGMN